MADARVRGARSERSGGSSPLIHTMDDIEYSWENCVVCGASEKEYFLESGFAMLLWHTEIGPMCEACYENYDEDDGNGVV